MSFQSLQQSNTKKRNKAFNKNNNKNEFTLYNNYKQIFIPNNNINFNFSKMHIQPKLKISQPNDPLEREADKVAGEVTKTFYDKNNSTHECLECNKYPEDELVASDIEPLISLSKDTVIHKKYENNKNMLNEFWTTNLHKSNGYQLNSTTKKYMEPRFGVDFSSVRIHNDVISDHLNQELGAAAFTYKNHIFFKKDRYEPNTFIGRHLIAHELTHVLQQRGNIRRKLTNTTNTMKINKEIKRLNLITNDQISPNLVQLKPEVEVKTNTPNKVRIVDDKKVKKQWNKASAGHATVSLMKKKSTFEIFNKRDPNLIVGKYGLTFFCQFHGGYGFHSNIVQKLQKNGSRKKGRLAVTGNLESHGCIRLEHNDAEDFYNSVSVGTPVKLLHDFPNTTLSHKTSARSEKSHVIRSGDTLSGIAVLYGVSQESIIEANPDKIHGPNNVIKIGDVLTIPVK
ncbi:MAG: DUF4157 domain-containing protein [Candidatus Nitrosocosmicus sp.]|nr:DUF4157 domain-containing protein [Candidatus Nitrosocosmicus sp.]